MDPVWKEVKFIELPIYGVEGEMDSPPVIEQASKDSRHSGVKVVAAVIGETLLVAFGHQYSTHYDILKLAVRLYGEEVGGSRLPDITWRGGSGVNNVHFPRCRGKSLSFDEGLPDEIARIAEEEIKRRVAAQANSSESPE